MQQQQQQQQTRTEINSEDLVKSMGQRLRLCQEDYRAEEREKKRAQAKIADLEQELRIVHRQLQQLQGRQMEELAERRRNALQNYREEYERTHPNCTPVFIGRGGLMEAEDGDGCDTVDSPHLNCPMCRKAFLLSDHELLLQHVNICDEPQTK